MKMPNEEKWREEIVELVKAGNISEDDLDKLSNIYLYYAPASLFKYCSPKQRNLDNIRDRKMWFSAPSEFNDVFDCRMAVSFDLFEKMAREIVPNNVNMQPGSQAWKKMKKAARQLQRQTEEQFDALRHEMGIACFSENEYSLLMWAHYASNHKGICVEYNMEDFISELGFSPVPVIYSVERAAIEEYVPNDSESLKQPFIDSLIRKSKEWEYEKEWRIIRDKGACGEKWKGNGALLDSVKPLSIILGCDCSHEVEDEIEAHCKSEKISLYKMEIDKALYKLNKKSILEFEDL